MTIRNSAFLLMLATLCPACAVDDEETEFRTTAPGTGGGIGTGIVFNTNMIDDESVSEFLQPMGEEHQGHSLEAVELSNGRAVEEFVIKDGDIVAYDERGQKYQGAELVGSVWSIGGVTTWMSALIVAERVLIDGWPHYRFQRGSLWGSTCHDDGSTVYARMLPGFTLDEATGDVAPLADNTYVACTNGATGKAARWGYYDLAVALGDFTPFEVAIRMIRADYCYDGVSYTHPGVEIVVEDAWNGGSGEGAIEAVWGADGLLCRGSGRTAAVPAKCGDQPALPTCASKTTVASYPGALFLTRLPAPVELH